MQKPVRQFDINLAKFPNPRGPGRLTGRLQTSLFYLGGMMEAQIEKPYLVREIKGFFVG